MGQSSRGDGKEPYRCPCGRSHRLPLSLGLIIGASGPSIATRARGGTYMVPRVWHAAHGADTGMIPALAARHGWPEQEAATAAGGEG